MTRRRPRSVDVPPWVDEVADESLHTDLLFALTRRAYSVASGATRSPKRRALLRRGDAVLARVEKHPTMKRAMDLVGEAEDLYWKAGDTVKRQPAFARHDLVEARKILAALKGLLGHGDLVRATRALTLAAGLRGIEAANPGKLDRRALGELYFMALRTAVRVVT